MQVVCYQYSQFYIDISCWIITIIIIIIAFLGSSACRTIERKRKVFVFVGSNDDVGCFDDNCSICDPPKTETTTTTPSSWISLYYYGGIMDMIVLWCGVMISEMKEGSTIFVSVLLGRVRYHCLLSTQFHSMFRCFWYVGFEFIFFDLTISFFFYFLLFLSFSHIDYYFSPFTVFMSF